jgi:predicted outer membrane protein
MEKVTRRATLALAMPATLLALAGCQTPTATSAPGGNMNPADLEFVTQAYNLILFDREEGSLAPTYAMTPAVKELAAKLVHDANAFAARLDPILKAQGITPPGELRTDLRVRLFHIRDNRGLDFDRSFVEDQIASHQEILDRYDMMMSAPARNPQLVALSREGIGEVRENLAALRGLQKQIIMGH